MKKIEYRRIKIRITNLINVRVVDFSEEANLLGYRVKTVRHV